MSKIEWTPSQTKAIEARGCDLIVSAAAGSGKTAVLTERIVRLLAEGSVRASRLAVVTFTKAAAAQLEQRLYDALSEKSAAEPENEILTAQLFGLSRAKISTIHSFCYSLIEKNRRHLGLGERVRIGDATETRMLLRRAAEEALEAFLSVEDEAEREEREALCRLFGKTRSDDGVLESVLKMKRACDSYPEGIGAFSQALAREREELAALQAGQKSYYQTETGRFFAREISFLLEGYATKLGALAAACLQETYLSERYAPFFALCEGELREAIDALERADAVRARDCLEELCEKSFRGLSGKESLSDAEKEKRGRIQECFNERIKKKIKAMCQSLFDRDEAALCEEMTKSVAASERMSVLLTLTQELYEQKKKNKSILDYADLERLTLSLVTEPCAGGRRRSSLAEQIASEFDAVFVDEYQDTNAIQDEIFRAITRGNNLFIVGDPKQSIYRFRGAEPSIFTDYKTKSPDYPDPTGGMQKVLLSENFRCDRTVIEPVNRIFSVLMASHEPESLYGDKDQLCFSKDPEKEEHHLAEIDLVLPKGEVDWQGEESEEREAREESAEANHIADRILSLLEDPAAPVLPKDVAVICRQKRQLAKVRAALTDRAIPCTGREDGRGDVPEYLFVTSFLAALNNPCRDVPLIAALSSPVFRFTDEMLYAVRRAKSGGSFYTALVCCAERSDALAARCREVLSTLEEWRVRRGEMSLGALVFSLYRAFCIEELFASDGTASQREFFLDRAADAAACGYDTLSSYLEYLETYEEEESFEGDGVRVMTIHKSKGLEFPVVFVSFLGGGFSTQEKRESLVFDREWGAAPNLPLEGGTLRYKTLLREAILMQSAREALEEEKRILYVALTRAKNRLIMTGTVSSQNTLKEKLLSFSSATLSPEKLSRLFRLSSSLLEMLLLSLREEGLCRAVEEGKDEKNGLYSLRHVASLPPVRRFVRKEEEEALFDEDEMLSSLSLPQTQAGLETLPKKLSVSEILAQRREEEEEELYPRRLMDFEKGQLVSSAARVGTATHQVMQFIDFEGYEADPEAEFARLVREGFLTREDLDLVDRAAIAGFFSSVLYAEMRSAALLVHERRFNAILPAEPILHREGEVLVQGVVDAWFETASGEIVLVDFKTDRVRAEDGEQVLRDRHGDQLRLYRLAVEAVTERRVSRLVIYSFALGKSVEVSLTEE